MPERRVVNDDKERGTVEKGVPSGGYDAPLRDNAGGHNRFVLPPQLDDSKSNAQDAK